MQRFVTLVMFLAFATGASGQEARRPPSSDGATSRLQAQIQQLGSEKAALEAENGRLKSQVEKLEKDTKTLATEKESLAKRAGSAESKISRAESGQQSVSARLESTESRLNEVVGKYKELVEQLRTIEAERNELAQRVATDGQRLKICVQKNVQLADVANEALDRYEKKGCFGALAQAEPFTGLKRVEVENAVEEYRQQIETLQVPDAKAPAGP